MSRNSATARWQSGLLRARRQWGLSSTAESPAIFNQAFYKEQYAMITSGIFHQKLASDCIDHDFSPIPIHYKSKQPVNKGWPDLRISHYDIVTYFNEHPLNIGILTGHASKGLVDVDNFQSTETGDKFQQPPERQPASLHIDSARAPFAATASQAMTEVDKLHSDPTSEPTTSRETARPQRASYEANRGARSPAKVTAWGEAEHRNAARADARREPRGSEPWGRCLSIFPALVVRLPTRLAAHGRMNVASQAAFGITWIGKNTSAQSTHNSDRFVRDRLRGKRQSATRSNFFHSAI
jgi:hypothetical protein